MKYIYPCKPNRLSLNSDYFQALANDPGWIAEIKKNGWRCLVYKEKEGVVLWTRHNTLIPMALPMIREVMGRLPDNTIVDGEIISTRRVKGAEDCFYAFDVLMFEGRPLHKQTFQERRKILTNIMPLAYDFIQVAMQFTTNKRSVYDEAIKDTLNEGIVLKKLSSTYPISFTSCQQNPSWLKVKRMEDYMTR